RSTQLVGTPVGKEIVVEAGLAREHDEITNRLEPRHRAGADLIYGLIEIFRVDRTHSTRVHGGLHRQLGGGFTHMGQISSREAVSTPRYRGEIEASDRAVAQVVLKDRLPRLLVRRSDECQAVKTARAEQCRIDVPGMIRCSEREHTFVTGPDAIELGEQLVDDVTAGAMAQLATFEADGIEFIEEEDAGSVAPGRLEQL